MFVESLTYLDRDATAQLLTEQSRTFGSPAPTPVPLPTNIVAIHDSLDLSQIAYRDSALHRTIQNVRKTTHM